MNLFFLILMDGVYFLPTAIASFPVFSPCIFPLTLSFVRSLAYEFLPVCVRKPPSPLRRVVLHDLRQDFCRLGLYGECDLSSFMLTALSPGNNSRLGAFLHDCSCLISSVTSSFFLSLVPPVAGASRDLI